MKIDTPTVHRNNSDSHYTKLDSKTIRLRLEGDPVTAKDILLDALTCKDDWLFTAKNIADRWDIPLKRARNKLSILAKAGHAEAKKIIDPKDGKILLHYWVFYETPLPQKRGTGKNAVANDNNKEKDTKPHCPKNGAMVPIKKHYKKQLAQQPLKSDLPEEVETELEGSGIEKKLAEKCQEKFKDTKYTLEAVRLAKTKQFPSAYFNFLSLEPRKSVLIRIEAAEKEAEKLDNDRKRLDQALMEQEQARQMAEMEITDFAEGARMMREALKKKRVYL